MGVGSSPLPVSFIGMFPLMLRALRDTWKPIVTVAVIVWGLFAVVFLAWFVASVRVEGFQLDGIQDILQNSGGNAGAEIYGSVIKNSFLFLLGLVVFPILYVCAVSFISTVAVRFVAEGYQPNSTGVLLLYRGLWGAVKKSLGRVPRMLLVYFVMLSLFILLAGGFIVVAVIAGVMLIEVLPPVLVVVYFVTIPALSMLLGVGLWFVIYTRWGLLAGQSAVLEEEGNPFRRSAELTSGHRWNLLGRVLVFTLLVGIVGSVVGGGFMVFEFAGIVFFFFAVIMRILVSILSSASIVAFFTPLFIELNK